MIFRSLFGGKDRPSIGLKSATMDDFGWTCVERDRNMIKWASPAGEAIQSLTFFAAVPNLPAPLSDLETLRDGTREQARNSNGAMVETDVRTIDDLPALQFIIKLPMQPTGFYFVGTIIVPFSSCSFVVRVDTREGGITGLREAVVFEKMQSEGKLEEDPQTGHPLNWFADPYDKNYQSAMLPNIADSVHFDADFPDHPLSILRKLLDHHGATMRFSEEVHKLPAFTG